MMNDISKLYILTDEENGDEWGMYETIEEAMEATKTLKARDYYITTSLETGAKTVVTVEEIEEYLTKWDEEEA